MPSWYMMDISWLERIFIPLPSHLYLLAVPVGDAVPVLTSTIGVGDMYPLPSYHTPPQARRGVPVPSLTTRVAPQFSHGLMSPPSANSHIDACDTLEMQAFWEGANLPPHQSPSPCHPNTPTQGFSMDTNPYGDMSFHIPEHISRVCELPTPATCVSGCFGDVTNKDVYSESYIKAAPFQANPQQHGLPTPGELPTANCSHCETSLTPSTSCDTLSNLTTESSSFNTLSLPTCYETSINEIIAARSNDMTTLSLADQECIVPMQTLANPMQDLSLYMSPDWYHGLSLNDYGTGDSQESPTPPMLSPVSPVSAQIKIDTDSHDTHEPKGRTLRASRKDASISRRIKSEQSKLDSCLEDVSRPESPSCSDSEYVNVLSSRTAVSLSRRMKKELKREQAMQTFERHTSEGIPVEVSMDQRALEQLAGGKKPVPSRKYACDFKGGCGREFHRSEHQKRHMKSHEETKPFKCVVERCGRDCSRSDNTTDHVYTHLKAWLRSDDGVAERSRTWGKAVTSKRVRSRNTLISPTTMRDNIIAMHGLDAKMCQKYFNRLNRGASDDFQIHINFEAQDCDRNFIRCYHGWRTSGGTCNICREVRTKK